MYVADTRVPPDVWQQDWAAASCSLIVGCAENVHMCDTFSTCEREDASSGDISAHLQERNPAVNNERG